MFNLVTGCTSNFINLESLIYQSVSLGFTGEAQSLYPSIYFTCNGSITGWSVLGRRHTGNNNTLYPDLQVWRGEGGGVYIRVGNTTLSEGIAQPGGTARAGIWEYPLETPLEFQAGDIFGIFQPLLDMSHLRVSVHRRLDSTPTVYQIHTNGAIEPLDSKVNLNDTDSYSDSTNAHVHISVSTGELV